MCKSVIRSGVAVTLWLSLTASAAWADTIDVFQAEGVFADNTTLGGTITVDLTSGKVVSSALSDSLNILYTNVIASQFNDTYAAYLLQIASSASVGNVPRLSLLLDAPSLVGYTGGIIYSTDFTSPEYAASDVKRTDGTPYLTSGTLTLVSSTMTPVPLPASAPLFSAALIALGAVGYAAKRKRAAVL